MKLILIALVLVCAAVAIQAQYQPENQYPNKGFDKPYKGQEGMRCLFKCTRELDPVCGVDKVHKSEPMWFSNYCMMEFYNCENHRHYQRIDKFYCPE